MTTITGTAPRGTVTTRPASPLRTSRDFRAIVVGDAVSQFGTQITSFILPLLAVTTLDATGIEVGLLQAVYMAPFFVLPLFAGVWLDRRTKRPVMIAMDLLRFALVLWIPVAALLGTLSMDGVYVVAFVGGAMTVVYDIAATSYLPVLLPGPQLAAGNSALLVNQAVGGTGGPGVAGWLSQLFGPAATLVFDALSYLTSASALLLVRHREQPPAAPGRRSVRGELAEGLRSVLRHPVIRAVAVHAGVYNAGAALMNVAYLIYFVRDLRHSGAQFGLVMVAGGVGAIIGAVVAPALMRRLGAGRAFGLVVVFSTTTYFLLPLSHGGTFDVVLGGFAFALGTAGASAGSVIAVTMRQRLTDPGVYARMNATYRLISFGLLAIGATTAGVIVDTAGARAALWIAPFVLIASTVPLYTRPVRQVGRLDGPRDVE
jgi:MFS family permease